MHPIDRVLIGASLFVATLFGGGLAQSHANEQAGVSAAVLKPFAMFPNQTSSRRYFLTSVASARRAIYAVGASGRPRQRIGRATVVKFSSSGSIDRRFGKSGRADISLPRTLSEFEPSVIRVRPDGRVVVAGWSTYKATDGELFSMLTVIQLTRSGRADRSFGRNGVVAVRNASRGPIDMPNGLLVLPSGKLVVTADRCPGGVEGFGEFCVLRLATSGKLDKRFGQRGFVRVRLADPTTNFAGNAEALARDRRGRILIAGSTAGSGPGRMAVARLNANGTLDTTFGFDGAVVGEPVNAAFGYSAYSVAVDSNSRVVVGGGSTYEGSAPLSPERHVVAHRLLENGSSDPSFGVGGRSNLTFFAIDSAPFTPTTTFVDLSDRVYALGRADVSGFVLRLTTSGVVDQSFGTMGQIDLPGPLEDYMAGVVTGKSLLVGGTREGKWKLWRVGGL